MCLFALLYSYFGGFSPEKWNPTVCPVKHHSQFFIVWRNESDAIKHSARV